MGSMYSQACTSARCEAAMLASCASVARRDQADANGRPGKQWGAHVHVRWRECTISKREVARIGSLREVARIGARAVCTLPVCVHVCAER